MEYIRKRSLYSKFVIIFILTSTMIFFAGYFAVKKLQTTSLRNMAKTMAGQVITFRSWIANTGVVWVDNLHKDFQDFLGEKVCDNNTTFYSKNPALATRELSEIVSKSQIGATFRITSKNYRNPRNKPDSFELYAINELEKKQNSFVERIEGKKYRYSVPLVVTEACLKCHGSPEKAPKEVIEKYGPDRGFGYKVGDVRGILTVNLPEMSFLELLAPVLNVYTIVLVVIGLLINFLLVKNVIVKRIENLTTMANKMQLGKLDLNLEESYEKESNDEIDKLYGAMDMMRQSLKVLIGKMVEF